MLTGLSHTSPKAYTALKIGISIKISSPKAFAKHPLSSSLSKHPIFLPFSYQKFHCQPVARSIMFLMLSKKK
jgi:hypothetical protein